jgi:heme/copper-type cytochrome/quinol oxidase subunit 2
VIATLAIATPVAASIATALVVTATVTVTISLPVAVAIMTLVVGYSDGRGRDVSSGVGALHRNRVDASVFLSRSLRSQVYGEIFR